MRKYAQLFPFGSGEGWAGRWQGAEWPDRGRRKREGSSRTTPCLRLVFSQYRFQRKMSACSGVGSEQSPKAFCTQVAAAWYLVANLSKNRISYYLSSSNIPCITNSLVIVSERLFYLRKNAILDARLYNRRRDAIEAIFQKNRQRRKCDATTYERHPLCRAR